MINISLSNYKFALILNNGIVYKNDCVKKYETENAIIWLVNPNEDKLLLSDLEGLDNKKKFVHELGGTWSCLIQDRKTNIYRAISSINNELPWYYTKINPYLISNNIFLIIKYLKNYNINYNAIASYLAFDHTFGGETFLNQISKVYGGDIINISENSIEITANDLKLWLGFDDSIYDKRILVDILIAEVENSLRDPFPVIQLTGGSDSRALLSAALKTNKKFTFMTGTAASVDKRDIKISKLIAHKLNIEHKTIDASKREVGNVPDILDRVTLETNAEFIPRNYLIFYKEYILAKEEYKNVGRIKGYGGEIFKGFYNNVNETIRKKVSIFAPNHSENLYSFILSIYSNYIQLNKINASNLFYQRERSHFWVGSNIRATLSYCKVYNPLQSPKLLAAGYRFNGGIQNSNIHENMIAILPESIKKIPINYSKLGYIWAYLLYKKFRSTVDYNYFLRPEFLRGNINFDLLNSLISFKQINSMIDGYEKRGLNESMLHKAFAVSNFFKIINK